MFEASPALLKSYVFAVEQGTKIYHIYNQAGAFEPRRITPFLLTAVT